MTEPAVQHNRVSPVVTVGCVGWAGPSLKPAGSRRPRSLSASHRPGSRARRAKPARRPFSVALAGSESKPSKALAGQAVTVRHGRQLTLGPEQLVNRPGGRASQRWTLSYPNPAEPAGPPGPAGPRWRRSLTPRGAERSSS